MAKRLVRVALSNGGGPHPPAHWMPASGPVRCRRTVGGNSAGAQVHSPILVASAGSDLQRFEVEGFRTQAKPMQIVSGPMGGESVHYEAPPSAAVRAGTRSFLHWINRTCEVTVGGPMDRLMRAGIAHLWFESIQPSEDGNGRVGRAVLDMAIAPDARLGYRLDGLSQKFRDRQARYYDELNRAQRGSGDATAWVLWFLEAFEASCTHAATLIDESVARARFWGEHRDVALTERQRKALNEMLDAGRGRFEGGMTPRKYAALTKSSSASVTRELTDLARKGLLLPKGQGRARRYELAIPGWEWVPPAAKTK